MFRTALSTVAAMAIFSLTTYAATDRWEDQVRVQMLGTALGAMANGFTLSEQMQVGALEGGQTETYALTVREGVQYMLVVNCDIDCTDVDVALWEVNGQEVVADRRSSDQAILMVPAGHKGAHMVAVTMSRCGAAPCRYGLGLFTK